MTEQEIIDSLTIHLPRKFSASYLNIHGGKDDGCWWEITFPDGERWKLTVEKIRDKRST